jgi:hypothetical protein
VGGPDRPFVLGDDGRTNGRSAIDREGRGPPRHAGVLSNPRSGRGLGLDQPTASP